MEKAVPKNGSAGSRKQRHPRNQAHHLNLTQHNWRIGKAGLCQLAVALAMPNRNRGHPVLSISVSWTLQATHQGEFFGISATGKQVTTTGTNIYRLANARIAESWFLADNLGTMQQLGVVPALGEA